MTYLKSSAFPMNFLDQGDSGRLLSIGSQTGMDLEDYFAAAALTGILANPHTTKALVEEICFSACSIARGMAAAMAKLHRQDAERSTGKTDRHSVMGFAVDAQPNEGGE